MSPLEAIGYALAALIAMPLVINLIVLAVLLIALAASIAFVAVAESANWLLQAWRGRK